MIMTSCSICGEPVALMVAGRLQLIDPETGDVETKLLCPHCEEEYDRKLTEYIGREEPRV